MGHWLSICSCASEIFYPKQVIWRSQPSPGAHYSLHCCVLDQAIIQYWSQLQALPLWPKDTAFVWLKASAFIYLTHWKRPGKDWRQRQKRVAEDEMVREHHWLNEHKFEQTPGDCDGQGKTGLLQSMESQKVRHNLATEQQQIFNKHFEHLWWIFENLVKVPFYS